MGRTTLQQPQLASNTLGYAQITSIFTSTSANSFQDVTGLTVTVVVPAGGRRIRVTFFSSAAGSAGAAGIVGVGIDKDGTVVHQTFFNKASGNANVPQPIIFSEIPSAGSHTYKIRCNGDGTNAMTISAGTAGNTTYTAGPAFILVELI